jgi:tetratricopeptide (TPR) repeat protein
LAAVSKERGSPWRELVTALQARIRSAIDRAIDKAAARMYPFGFTVPAKRALVLTQDEAERMQQPSVGTGHLLLGLVREPDGLASRVLSGFGLEIDAARAMLSEEPLEVTATAGFQGVTSGTKRVIGKAYDEKQRTGSTSVGTEHLLVGILLEGRGHGALVLARSGVTLERTRERVRDLLAQGLTDSPRSYDCVNLPLEKLSLTAESALLAGAGDALEFGARPFGSEYVLLGILAQTGSLGARVLTELAITSDAVRARLTRAPAAEAGADATMDEGLRVELQKIFLAHQTDVAIDTSALAQAVLAGGGLGGAILGSFTTRQKLDQTIASLRTSELSEEPIGRFSSPLRLLWNQRALCRIWAGRYADARADFLVLRANASTPLERAAYANNQAWVNLLMGDRSLFEESLALAQEALAISPDRSALRSTLAFALIQNGRSREGVEMLEATGGENEDKRIAAERSAILALGKWRAGDRGRARTLLQRATKLDPECVLLPRVRAEFEPTPG